MAKQNVREHDEYLWGLLRLAMGWIFLWPFLDKLLGLGFATPLGSGWLAGGSPTLAFLSNSSGPFSSFYQALAGNVVVDYLFMIGILLIGLSMLFGVGVKISGYSGALLLMLMYTAGFVPPKNNPFLDEHIIYAIIMVGLATVRSGHKLGFGRWWGSTKLVKKLSWLE